MTTVAPKHESKAMRRRRERIESRQGAWAELFKPPYSDIVMWAGSQAPKAFHRPGSHKH